MVEVFHKTDTHNARTSRRYIGITREITEDLHGEHKRCDNDGKRGRFISGVVHRVYVGCHKIRNAYLLEEAEHHLL